MKKTPKITIEQRSEIRHLQNIGVPVNKIAEKFNIPICLVLELCNIRY